MTFQPVWTHLTVTRTPFPWMESPCLRLAMWKNARCFVGRNPAVKVCHRLIHVPSLRYRKVSKIEVSIFRISHSLQNLTGTSQHCCRRACQISKRYEHFNPRSRAFKTLRDLVVLGLSLVYNTWPPNGLVLPRTSRSSPYIRNKCIKQLYPKEIGNWSARRHFVLTLLTKNIFSLNKP